MAIFSKSKSTAFNNADDSDKVVTSDDLDAWAALFATGELDNLSRDDLAYLLNRVAATVKEKNVQVRSAKDKLGALEREAAARPSVGRTGSPTEAFDFMTEAQKESALKNYATREIASIENARNEAEQLRKRYTKAFMAAQARLTNLCENHDLPNDAVDEIDSIKDRMRSAQDNVFASPVTPVDEIPSADVPSTESAWVSPEAAYGSGVDTIDGLFDDE